MLKCKSCGATDNFDIKQTVDGFREYRCQYCGTIMKRENLLEHYKKYDVFAEFRDKPNSCDLGKMKRVREELTKELRELDKFYNFLSHKYAYASPFDQQKVYYWKGIVKYEEIMQIVRTKIRELNKKIYNAEESIAYAKTMTECKEEFDKNGNQSLVNPITSSNQSTTPLTGGVALGVFILILSILIGFAIAVAVSGA